MESRLPLEPHKGLLSSPASEDATENKNKGTSIIDLKRVNRPSVRLFESRDFARIRENNQWELLYQEIQESDLYHELQNRIKNQTRLKREIEALNEVIHSQNDQVHSIQGSLDNVFKEIESLYCKHLSTDEANAFDKNNKGLCNKALRHSPGKKKTG